MSVESSTLERPEASPADLPMIRLADVHKTFGRLEVLKGITLEVAAGQVVCIIGASGSGKSTLLRCVNRLEDPTAGRIERVSFGKL